MTERRSSRPIKKIPSYGSVGGAEEDEPSISAEDGEVDETFVALQKLLKALNRTNRTSTGSNNSSSLSAGNSAQRAAIDQQQISREELLESRRQERDRVRRSLFAKNSNNDNAYNSRYRRTCPAYYCSEEEEEEEAPEPSVESRISNRFMNGSFSNLNVHVISRIRWSTEDRVVERFPVVMLPESGNITIPTDNEKINVVHTDEYIDLRDNLIANLPSESVSMHYLTPPRSTWYMQMHSFEGLKC
ncbi:hypothetical protein PsorP6_004183 [Peronosclerospora sorghi]|uniref:Uncharacterized protein n=1 Tax=Peronosclerospora sorghi TaxID=230839 RepID=A0ACC0VPL0_9STRA|nr:hypothetical protein PsorP6_004183 [Peronosclerospora sorghi]